MKFFYFIFNIFLRDKMRSIILYLKRMTWTFDIGFHFPISSFFHILIFPFLNIETKNFIVCIEHIPKM